MRTIFGDDLALVSAVEWAFAHGRQIRRAANLDPEALGLVLLCLEGECPLEAMGGTEAEALVTLWRLATVRPARLDG